MSYKAEKLDKYAGDKVTVMGHEACQTRTIDAKLKADETKEAVGKPHADFQVMSLKKVGGTCGGSWHAPSSLGS